MDTVPRWENPEHLDEIDPRGEAGYGWKETARLYGLEDEDYDVEENYDDTNLQF